MVYLSGSGPYTLQIQICVGFGGNGATSGGGGTTGNINIGVYGGSTMTLNSFSPSSIVGPISGDTLTGSNVGSISSPIVSPVNLSYTSSSGIYSCVGSPSTCGSSQQSCFYVTLVLSDFPDSLRVFGIEGNSNYTAGCSNDADMLLTFNSFLPVSWLTFEAELLDLKRVSLDWDVAMEENCRTYEIYRTDILEHHPHWEKLGEVAALNQLGTHSYQFIDEYSIPEAYYRVVQRDFDGISSSTRVVHVKQEETWFRVYPNPATDIFVVESGEDGEFSLFDASGKVRLEGDFEKFKTLKIDIANFEDGIYFLRVYNQAGSSVKPLIVSSN
jgi:hypothetical protein